MAQIPIARDVAELIGNFAEGVQNRSLLLDKYSFHKLWPEEVDHRGRQKKCDEASRWSFKRLSHGGPELLHKESIELRRKSGGRNVEEDSRLKMLELAKIAESLAQSSCESPDAQNLRARHTQRFVSLFQRSFGKRCLVMIGRLEGRLAINLADSLLPNAGIALDRLFGLPFIPGSAIKGCARHAAVARLRLAPESEKEKLFDHFRRIFGTSVNDFGDRGQLCDFVQLLHGAPKDLKGAVSFQPSYPIDEDAKLIVDLTNVHYPRYYKSGNTRDLANEEPRLNPFPTVEVGARFAFCAVLNGIDPDLVLLDSARGFIEEALTVNGIGAKTASGYGWFSIDNTYLAELTRKEEERNAELERERQQQFEAEESERLERERVASLTPEDLASEQITILGEEAFALYAKELAGKSEPEQRAFIAQLRSNKERRERWRKWKKKKPDLAKSITEICASLQLPLLP